MSTTAKVGVGLVIILALIVIGWFIFSKPVNDLTHEPVVEKIVLTTPTPTPIAPNTAGTGLTEESDLSTESINKDIEAVGKQFDSINSDAINADAGLNVANEIK